MGRGVSCRPVAFPGRSSFPTCGGGVCTCVVGGGGEREAFGRSVGRLFVDRLNCIFTNAYKIKPHC